MMNKQLVSYGPKGVLDSTRYLYSQGVSDGKYLYISGQIAWNEQGELVGHDVRTQVRRAFENLGLVLQETVSFIIKS